MTGRLEHLFWILGAVLVLPFIVHHGVLTGKQDEVRQTIPQLRSVPVLPAVMTSLTPAEESPASSIVQPGGHHARDPRWQEAAERFEAPVARLVIPALQSEVAVFASGGEWALSQGAGVIADTADLNQARNIGVASHADGHFQQLDRLALGDLLLLETDWTLRQFRVVDSRRATAPEALAGFDGQSTMTLVRSPAGNGSDYLIVSALEVQHTRAAADQPALPRPAAYGYSEKTLKF
ncbi:sortase domain-containing protein [Gilvimarinus sp. F26214L]|uniref:sortase domain-containing protein n=1 Tax=Gilvimarinus sp. DZF01 TaxID=3461371 RepID=UPI0040455951